MITINGTSGNMCDPLANTVTVKHNKKNSRIKKRKNNKKNVKKELIKKQKQFRVPNNNLQ